MLRDGASEPAAYSRQATPQRPGPPALARRCASKRRLTPLASCNGESEPAKYSRQATPQRPGPPALARHRSSQRRLTPLAPRNGASEDTAYGQKATPQRRSPPVLARRCSSQRHLTPLAPASTLPADSHIRPAAYDHQALHAARFTIHSIALDVGVGEDGDVAETVRAAAASESGAPTAQATRATMGPRLPYEALQLLVSESTLPPDPAPPVVHGGVACPAVARSANGAGWRVRWRAAHTGVGVEVMVCANTAGDVARRAVYFPKADLRRAASDATGTPEGDRRDVEGPSVGKTTSDLST